MKNIFYIILFYTSIYAEQNHISTDYSYYLGTSTSFSASSRNSNGANFGLINKNMEYFLKINAFIDPEKTTIKTTSYEDDIDIYSLNENGDYVQSESFQTIYQYETENISPKKVIEFSINRNNIKLWKTYKNMVISNYWGLELQSKFQSQTRKEERQQNGYISSFENDTSYGQLFVDTLITSRSTNLDEENFEFGLGISKGIKLEYKLSKLLGTELKDGDFNLELDCKLINLLISKSIIDYDNNNIIYSSNFELKNTNKIEREEKGLKIYLTSPSVIFRLKYYF